MDIYKTLVIENHIKLEDLSKDNLLLIIKKQEDSYEKKISQYKNINDTQTKTIEKLETKTHDLKQNITNVNKENKKINELEKIIQGKDEDIERYKQKIQDLSSRNRELFLDNKRKIKINEDLKEENSQLSDACSEWLKQSNDICELMGKSTDGWSNVPGDTFQDIETLIYEKKELEDEINKFKSTCTLGKSEEQIEMIKKENLLQFIDEHMKWTHKKIPIRCQADYKYYNNAPSQLNDIVSWINQSAKKKGELITKGKNRNVPTRDEIKLWLEQMHKERYTDEKEWVIDPRGYPYSQNGTIKNPRYNLILIKDPLTGEKISYN